MNVARSRKKMDLKTNLGTAIVCCWMWLGLVHSDGRVCLEANAESCEECIQAGQNCGWCSQAEFLRHGVLPMARCDDIESLKRRGCPMEHIENPKGSVRIISDKNLTGVENGKKVNSEDVSQIQTQKLIVKLRPGEPQTFSLQFQRAEDYPIDLYYLVDLSLSQQDDLENMKRLGIELERKLQKTTTDFRIGLGILQKNSCTAGEICGSQFSFKNVLSLTSDGARFNTLLNSQTFTASQNSSEDGTDAIMQAVVCGDTTGWRSVTKMLVYYTNTGLHFARDGKGSGLLPNDGKCHIDSQGVYTLNHHHDHPSISQLAQKLADNNIHLFFAVNEEFKDIYKMFHDSIPKSEVGILTPNSSDVIKLILDAYHALSFAVILENSSLPEGVTMHSTVYCNNNTVHTEEDSSKCSGIHTGDKVKFDIHITAKKCPKNEQEATIQLKPTGFNEKVEITLKFLCECECHKQEITKRPDCNEGNGKIECGVCKCNEGRIGRFCECNIDEIYREDMLASCRKDNASLVCSGNGDCICGECECKKRENPNEYISGKYCECDNFSCDRFNGLLCGGNGICHCGKCECLPTFTGSACHCSIDMDSCKSPNGRICNNKGICECGQCRCTEGFTGPTCEHCPTCSGVCTDLKDCVLCKAFKKGPKKEICDQCGFEVTLVDRPDELPQSLCRFMDPDIGNFCFSYFFNNQNVPEVHVVKIPVWC
ncbi:integrin beta-1-like isoform X2 [Chiloscyllium plagiosum]|uniref:integrin beta-1-like isoform X2 n=1 Tax=Chiloscyllium plagiosum TaxID=36176 RepID=UPI001CB80031|nr:integrin beta-1-like isoform X2 [Chiloscyllium plagiosum]